MSNDEFVIEPQQANLLEIELLGSYAGIGSDNIHVDTTAGWEAQPELVAKLGHLYVYSDYDEKDGVDIPAIKVGDGVSLVVDLPFTTVDLTDIETAISAIQSALEGKVDKVEGKGLSTNDFTDADVTKLNGIEPGAEVNVQADWNQTDASADDYIKNKPSVTGAVWGSISGTLSDQSDLNSALGNKVDKVQGKGLSTEDFTTSEKAKLDALPTNADLETALSGKVDKVTGKQLSTEDFTTAEKTKLEGIEAGAQVNTVTGVKGSAESTYRTGNIDITKANIGLGNVDNTSDLNKPISTATQTALDGKVDKVTGKGLSENDYTTADKDKLAGIAAGAEVNVQSNWNESDSSADSYIQNKPSIPAKTSDLTNDSGYITGVNWGSIGGTLADQTDLNNELSALNTGLSSAVKSVNNITPDSNGNVEVSASDIPANGMGERTTSGNPIEIEDGVAGNALDLSVDLEPIQDLHGYANPWPAGGGKNKLNATDTNEWMTLTDGVYKITSVPSGNESFLIGTVHLVPGDYILNGGNTESFRVYITVDGQTVKTTGQDVSFTITTENDYFVRGVLKSDARVGWEIKPMIRLSSVSDATFAPYSNICPISGRTGTSITRTDGDEENPSTASVSFGQTVYGGEIDFTNGTGTSTIGFIASYNGETINEPWISSMDEYVSGTTPTIGAQVAYPLTTPIELTLTPAQLALLEGYNILTTDGDTINLRYIGTEASDVQAEIDEFENVTYKLTTSIAPIETGTASQNYAVGKYLLLNGQFCKVTAAIATGETITVGTNVAETSVGDELNSNIVKHGHTEVISVPPNAYRTYTISLPSAFSNANYQVSLTQVYSSATTYSNVFCSAVSKTSSQFDVRVVNNRTDTALVELDWIAVGE